MIDTHPTNAETSTMQQKFTLRREIFSKDCSTNDCFGSSVGSSKSSLHSTNTRLPRRSSSGRLDAKNCYRRRAAVERERSNQSLSGLRRSKRSACLVSDYSSGSLSMGQEPSLKNATFSRPPSLASSETSMFTDGSGSSPSSLDGSVTRFDTTIMLKALQDKHVQTLSAVRFEAPRRSSTISSSTTALSSFLPNIPIEEETWGHFADVNDEEEYRNQPLHF